MTSSVGTAVAQRQNTPAGLIDRYSGDFVRILPTHIKAEAWIRQAQAALKKGKISIPARNGNPPVFELEVAANNNPAAFFSALLDAASQGLKPGTAEYYLTPRKVNGKLEILGMRGYQGEIEMIYRAGAVSAVIAEVVRKNDRFQYRLGLDDAPVHEFDPFAGESTRGEMIGVYAYGKMRDGSISRVVMLGREAIERIKGFAQGTSSEYSPWNTSTEAMWLKSAVHQLQKWVPTSAEYRNELREDAASLAAAGTPLQSTVDMPDIDPNRNGDTELEYIDADVVPDDDPAAQLPPPQPESAPAGPPRGDITKIQEAKLDAALRAKGVGSSDPARRMLIVGQLAGRPVGSISELMKDEAQRVIDTLESMDRAAVDAIADDPMAWPQAAVPGGEQ